MSKPENQRQSEVDANFAVFSKLLPELLEKHPGKFALMHDGNVLEIVDTMSDAVRLGQRLYPDGMFSIQEITARTENLGFYSYAMSHAPL